MKGKDFDWQTNEFMLYCPATNEGRKAWWHTNSP